MFCKKGVLKNFAKSQEKTCISVSFLIKLQGSACNFIKKELWHRFFPVNFAKTIFFAELFWVTASVNLIRFCGHNYFCSVLAKPQISKSLTWITLHGLKFNCLSDLSYLRSRGNTKVLKKQLQSYSFEILLIYFSLSLKILFLKDLGASFQWIFQK